MNARSQLGVASSPPLTVGPFDALAGQLRADVQEGLIPGAVARVERAGRVELFDWCGVTSPQGQAPMRGDSIFWIASMTKPVTSALAMLLVEDGLLNLEQPVAAYLPQMAQLRLQGNVPPRTPPRVVDLLRHTAGFTYGSSGATALHLAYEAAAVYDHGQTNAQMIDKLSALPLMHEPGTTFEYGMSTDVLGRVIEVCSGEPLEELMARRIFQPLGMADTGFTVAPADAHRVARPFGHEPFAMAPPADGSARWRSGGGGLWSTAADYSRFARMLLNFGELDGVRILARSSVGAMRSPQLPAGVLFGDYTGVLGPVAPTPQMGQDFGLGLCVRTGADANPLPGSVGDFSWPGVSGTLFWCDPAHALTVVVMLQSPSLRHRYRALCRQLVYSALVKEQA
jgi:CubicO group peptidase (beta-lactamase class C family)